MGSNAKTGKFFIGGSQEQKRCTFLVPKHKSTIWHRTPPTYTSNLAYIYMCVGGVQGSQILQTELNYLDLLNTYCNVSDFGFLGSWGWSRWVGGIQGDQL